MAQSPKTSQKTPETRKKTSGLRSRAQREWESRFPDPGTMEDLSADEMRRAIQELIFNVIKHSGAKKASERLFGSDDRHILSVSDLGCGFNTEILNSLEKKAD